MKNLLKNKLTKRFFEPEEHAKEKLGVLNSKPREDGRKYSLYPNSPGARAVVGEMSGRTEFGVEVSVLNRKYLAILVNHKEGWILEEAIKKRAEIMNAYGANPKGI